MYNLYYNTCIAEDITDPTPWEEVDTRPVIGVCPICGEEVHRGEDAYIACGGTLVIHADCEGSFWSLGGLADEAGVEISDEAIVAYTGGELLDPYDIEPDTIEEALDMIDKKWKFIAA